MQSTWLRAFLFPSQHREQSNPQDELLTKIVEVASRSTDGESAAYTNPETHKSDGHDKPPHTNKCSRHIKQDAIKNQKRGLDSPKYKKDQKRYCHSELQVVMVERISEWRRFLFLCLYSHDSKRVRESFGVGGGKTDQKDQRKQMGSIIPEESFPVGISNGKPADG